MYVSCRGTDPSKSFCLVLALSLISCYPGKEAQISWLHWLFISFMPHRSTANKCLFLRLHSLRSCKTFHFHFEKIGRLGDFFRFSTPNLCVSHVNEFGKLYLTSSLSTVQHFKLNLRYIHIRFLDFFVDTSFTGVDLQSVNYMWCMDISNAATFPWHHCTLDW